VRKTLWTAFLAVLPLLGTGCGQVPTTARPLNAPGLVLSVPAPEKITPNFTLIQVMFHYRAASGPDVFSGSVSLNQLPSINGPVNIDLPHDGQWLVSAELTTATTPLYIGADLATVSGTTTFPLELGNLNTACYSVSIANPGSNAGVPDLLTFDTAVTAYSPGTGDIQALLGATSMYLQTYPTARPAFAYLGNGTWVDFTDIPTGTVFYNDSLTAKQALLGATAVMAAGDVYAIQLSATNTAWIQVMDELNIGATYTHFLYRLNRHGYPYLKFDVTAYGNANCNTSGINLY